ncbi:hypothetical protein C8R44DRAFT_69505 [Mycena epipterygia]|nr:hypothetical protein C8R44DRAFT_69505 [Mycena epipterygia]
MNAHDLQVWIACLLIGSWLNMSLFTLEIALCFFYMRRWNLGRANKWGFFLMMINDTLGTLCVCANLFLFVVDGVHTLEWPVSTLIISSALSAIIEQTFLVHRYWKVTQNTFLSAFIMLVSASHVALSLASVVLGSPNVNYYIAPGVDMTALASIICTIADLLISLSMVWSLSGIKPVWRSTQHLIRSVCINALTSGIVVASVTLLAMVTLLIQDLNRIFFTLFFAIMGRVYSLTVVVNFIHRNIRPTAVNSLYISDPGELSASALASVSVGGFRASTTRSPRPSVRVEWGDMLSEVGESKIDSPILESSELEVRDHHQKRELITRAYIPYADAIINIIHYLALKSWWVFTHP